MEEYLRLGKRAKELHIIFERAEQRKKTLYSILKRAKENKGKSAEEIQRLQNEFNLAHDSEKKAFGDWMKAWLEEQRAEPKEHMKSRWARKNLQSKANEEAKKRGNVAIVVYDPSPAPTKAKSNGPAAAGASNTVIDFAGGKRKASTRRKRNRRLRKVQTRRY